MAARVVGKSVGLSSVAVYPVTVGAVVASLTCEVSARPAARVVGSEERFGGYLLRPKSGAFADIGAAPRANKRSAAEPSEQTVVAARADTPLLAAAPAFVDRQVARAGAQTFGSSTAPSVKPVGLAPPAVAIVGDASGVSARPLRSLRHGVVDGF